MGINSKGFFFILLDINMKGDKKKSYKFKKNNLPWNKGISTHCADSNEACADSSDVSDPPRTQIKANRTVRKREEEYYLVTNNQKMVLQERCQTVRDQLAQLALQDFFDQHKRLHQT